MCCFWQFWLHLFRKKWMWDNSYSKAFDETYPSICQRKITSTYSDPWIKLLSRPNHHPTITIQIGTTQYVHNCRIRGILKKNYLAWVLTQFLLIIPRWDSASFVHRGVFWTHLGLHVNIEYQGLHIDSLVVLLITDLAGSEIWLMAPSTFPNSRPYSVRRFR